MFSQGYDESAKLQAFSFEASMRVYLLASSSEEHLLQTGNAVMVSQSVYLTGQGTNNIVSAATFEVECVEHSLYVSLAHKLGSRTGRTTDQRVPVKPGAIVHLLLAAVGTVAIPFTHLVDGIVDKVNTVAVILSLRELEEMARLDLRFDNAVYDTQALHIELAAFCRVFIKELILFTKVGEEGRTPMPTKGFRPDREILA